MDVDSITVALVNKTLRAWQQGREPPSAMLHLDLLPEPETSTAAERAIRLRDYILELAADELARARQAEHIPSTPPAATRQALLAAISRDFAGGRSELQAWSALYHRYLAPIEFSVEELAAAVHMDPRHFRRLIDAGTRRLTEQLRRAEMSAHQRNHAGRRRQHLPPSDYAQLFGIAAPQAELVHSLSQPDGYRFISIEGLGGIGKTALARAVAFELAKDSEFEGIVWISARQSWLNESGMIESAPDAAASLAEIVNQLAAQLGLEAIAGLGTNDKLARISSYLDHARYLVVIDNLETVRDVDALLPALSPLAETTRFLFTSRQTMSGYPLVYRHAVAPLSLVDSKALVESELRRHGRDQLIEPEDMSRLYELLGGMPLALKLISAQMSRWPLSALLDDMRRLRRRAPENLYTYIYRRTWLALDDPARAMLLSLLHIAPDGEDVEWLQLVSALPPDEFDDALAQLLAYSLLEAAGPVESPRYRLHRLTVTFLHTEFPARWDDVAGQE